MSKKPNVLFLMTDQMQGRVLNPDHPCHTPNLDKLIANGFRIRNAYTPNAVCSPARASLMTGLLPHNHGVLSVTHCMDEDQGNLRLEHPHWAQRMQKEGYKTGYFGKWHVERTDRVEDFGWQVNGVTSSSLFQHKKEELAGQQPVTEELKMKVESEGVPGYDDTVLYGVTPVPAEQRNIGITTELALDFLDEALEEESPWCCFVSTTEPHDPFICGQEAYERYDAGSLPLAPNMHDDLINRPGLYRKVQRVWKHFDDRNRQEAMACYYGMITEIDEQYGRIIEKLRRAGQLDDTIVVFTSDHGELLGAHGLYTKNISAFEEVYNIPLVMSGPGISPGVQSDARVGLHDLCQTILELTGCKLMDTRDSSSFAPLLKDPGLLERYRKGFAEYNGTRVMLTQRIVWDGPWKYVFNGFDFDELYHLEQDPFEMHNVIDDPAYDDVLRKLSAQMWSTLQETGDEILTFLGNPSLRIPTFGPNIGHRNNSSL